MIIAGTTGIGQVLADDQQGNNPIVNDTGNHPLADISNGSPTVLSLGSHTYYPNDNVGIYVYNATSPLVSIIDPSGNSYNVTMLEVNDSAYFGEYELTSGIVLSNYTVQAIDNATGFIIVDQFEVVSRSVTVTPLADNATMPQENTSATSLYLYLTSSQSTYSPGDHTGFTVSTNAGVPTLTVRDPAGKTRQVVLSSGQNDTYNGVYGLDQAVVLGNYTATAAVNSNGTYTYTTAYFNVTLGDNFGGDGVSVKLVAYDPVQKAFVIKASMASNTLVTPEKAVNDTPAIKGLAVKGVKVMQSSAASQTTSVAQSDESKQIEVIVPADNGSMSTIAQRYNISKDISKATMSDSISADGTQAHVSLNDKVDGCWYRMSVSIPAGYTVDKIVRADGIEIKNDVQIDRSTGAVVKNDVNWYVDNGTLYFYDDPINGYDITLQPPMASNSLAVNLVNGGQLSAIVYPFSQTDTSTTIKSNDHLGRTGDSYANEIDGDAGTKTAVRMYNVNDNSLIMFGNDGTSYHTYSSSANQYTDIGTPTTIGFNTVPDGSVESVILSNYKTPQVTGAPSNVTITQKTIIRNNNLWFATIYYITNTGAGNINNFRFFEGSDFNFNGQFTSDDDFYDPTNDLVYGYENNQNPNSVHVGGYRSILQSSKHDVDQYGTIWNRIAADTLNSGTSTNNIDAGMALAWDHGTLKTGETWVVPVIWAVGSTTASFTNTLNNAITNNVYDVGIKGITSPSNGASVDSLTTPTVTINATAMDVGVTDQNPTVVLNIKDSTGKIVYTTSTTTALSIPYTETSQVSFSWNLGGVTPGAYTISVNTQLKDANGHNLDQNSANDMKSIVVNVSDFSVYQSQWGHANPGDNIFYPLTMANMGPDRTFDITASASTAQWPTYLYYKDTTIPLAYDDNGDGTWEWVNTLYADPVTGLPCISLKSNTNDNILVQKLVPTNADAATLDTTILSINQSGQPLISSVATLKTDTPFPSAVGKTFYIHAKTMNTAVDAAGSTTIPITSIFQMWSQTPAFADNFNITGNVNIQLYYTAASSMPITATLFYTNGAGSTTQIGSATDTLTAVTGTPALHTFTFTPINTNVVVPAGSYLVLKIDNIQTTTLTVYYGSNYKTCVQVNTPTYVHVNTINTYDGATLSSNFAPGDKLHVTANVSDPIGAYDIPSATISVIGPTGTVLVNNQQMTNTATDTSTPPLWKLFDYPAYTLSTNLPSGVYTVTVTGYESNGVTHVKTTQIILQSNTPAVLITPSNTKVSTPNTVWTFKHTVTNLNNFNSDVFDISYISSIPGWSVTLLKADGVTLLSDTNNDGIPDTGTVAPLDSVDIVVQVSVPTYANSGDVDAVQVTARSSNSKTVSSTATDTLSINTNFVVKSLYTHTTTALGNYLDTSSVSTGTTLSMASGRDTIITQSLAFANTFTMVDDPSVTLYLYNPGNSVTGNIVSTLKYSMGSTTTTLGTVTSTYTIGKKSTYTLKFNIHLSSYNIPAGSKLILDLKPNKALTLYQSSAYPSHIDMDTLSYINIQSVSVNDTNNNPITSTTPPSTVKVFVNVTDPFGSQSISSARLNVTDSNGNTVLGPYTMNQVGIDAGISGSTSLWKKFEYDVNLLSSLDTGNYYFVVNATEDNGVTDISGTTLSISYPIHVTASKSFVSSGSNSFTATVILTNLDTTHTVKGVHGYDFYSSGFTCSGFSDPHVNVVPVNNGLLSGNINIFGPFDLQPGKSKTITYTAQGSGNYNVSDMYVVGVDPHV